MSVAKLIAEAITKLEAGDPEGALIQVCIAADATAKREYPKIPKNHVRYKSFLHDNLALIGGVAIGVWAKSHFRLKYQHKDLKTGPSGCCDLEDLLYHVVRCCLLHEGEVPKNMRFVPERVIRQGLAGELVLPYSLVIGLLLAVVGSPANAAETIPARFHINVDGRIIQINELWGEKERMNKELGP